LPESSTVADSPDLRRDARDSSFRVSSISTRVGAPGSSTFAI
jgi:hypothetical protein